MDPNLGPFKCTIEQNTYHCTSAGASDAGCTPFVILISIRFDILGSLLVWEIDITHIGRLIVDVYTFKNWACNYPFIIIELGVLY